MNSFDDIFEGHISQRGQTNQPFDKEAWAEKKQAERRAEQEEQEESRQSVFEARA